MIRLFCDTEFTDFISPKLISIGLVSECGKHEFYAELTDYPEKQASGFVKAVVVPLLNHSKYGNKEVEVAAKLATWLEDLGDEVTICIDYPTDHYLLMDLVEGILSPNVREEPEMLYVALDAAALTKGIQLSTPDLGWFRKKAREEFHAGFLDYFFNSKAAQHHALEDAKGNRHGWIRAINWINRDY